MVGFGRCSVDVATRVVERDGEPQHLEPQAFDLLAYLISNADRVVPKADLLDAVWGDQFVSESALTTRIKEIRHALGDDGVSQAVIKNFRGRGYRFVAELGQAHRQPAHAPVSHAGRPTSLVGRDDDAASIRTLLEQSALVTLVGPGGVGKTTLAHEVARQVGDGHRDGVKVVRLAQTTEPASVIHVFRRDTGLVETGTDDALIESFASLDALVVIDNCEHVLDEVGSVVASILARGGTVRMLATSRERLGLPGEQVQPLAPLDDEAARALLLSRARRVLPSYAWRQEDESTVYRILQAIDRLPLAIEMAAARLPAIGAADLAALLSSRLELLRSADRTAAQRHRTIDALIAWSEDLLDGEERGLLAALSVFSGPVAAMDIAAVVEADPAELAIGPLAGLVDKSLVVADTGQVPTCYGLLETVRARAARRRPSTVAARHAHHITAVVTACDRLIRSSDEPSAAERVDALAAEIRSAHAWARSNDPTLSAELTAALLIYAHERQWTEPAAWARALVDQLGADDPLALAGAASLAADASNRGDYDQAAQLARRASASDDPRIVGSAHDTLANIGLYTGDLDAAHRHGIALIALGDRTGDTWIRNAGILSEVLSFVYGGRIDEGQAAFDRHDTSTGLGPTSSAWIAYVRGELLSGAGREREAIAQFEHAARLGSTVGSRFVVSVAQVSALAAATRSGDAEGSLAAFLPLLAQYRQAHSHTHAITTLRNLIGVMVRAGLREPAMVLLGALSNLNVKSTYGSESDRLNEARQTATERVGDSIVGTWVARGTAHDVTWALDYAIEVLTGLEQLTDRSESP